MYKSIGVGLRETVIRKQVWTGRNIVSRTERVCSQNSGTLRSHAVASRRPRSLLLFRTTATRSDKCLHTPPPDNLVFTILFKLYNFPSYSIPTYFEPKPAV